MLKNGLWRRRYIPENAVVHLVTLSHSQAAAVRFGACFMMHTVYVNLFQDETDRVSPADKKNGGPGKMKKTGRTIDMGRGSGPA